MNAIANYIKNIKNIITVLLIFLVPGILFVADIEYEVKAGFFKHFSKSFTWPPSVSDKQNFYIGVLGDSKIYDIGKRVYENTKLKGKKVEFKKYKNISELDYCHILFISKNYEGDLDSVVSICNSRSILSMSEKEDYGELGVMINFFITPKGTTAFEINPRSIIKAKLEFDLNILNLGTIVGE